MQSCININHSTQSNQRSMITVSIIGLGLIGGSIAKDLITQLNINVVGVDSNTDHCQQALDCGLVNEVCTIDEALDHSDIIILAIPVDVIESILPSLLDKVRSDQVIIDVGSTKAGICDAVANHQNRKRYVAAHPLAGTEFSGPSAAINGLFRGKKCIICDQEASDDDAVTLGKQLFHSIGMETYFQSSSSHDKHLAYVSHLSHITSFTLSLTVLDIMKDESQILNLASTGFDSTVRLAKSNPKTWKPIFSKNRKHLSLAIGQYLKHLEAFKQALDEDDQDESESMMTQANTIKTLLNNTQL